MLLLVAEKCDERGSLSPTPDRYGRCRCKVNVHCTLHTVDFSHNNNDNGNDTVIHILQYCDIVSEALQ